MTPSYILHQDQPIGSLDLISFEGKQSIDFGNHRVWIRFIVLEEIFEIVFQKMKLFLRYCF